MSTPRNFDKLEITLKMIAELITEQFPQWSYLEINPVERNGIDNRTFRLGTEMSIRLPSAKEYALQVLKEQRWLLVLASHLSFPIPEPLALGN